MLAQLVWFEVVARGMAVALVSLRVVECLHHLEYSPLEGVAEALAVAVRLMALVVR